MKLSIGIGAIVLGICAVLVCCFLNFNLFFNQVLAFLLGIACILVFYIGIIHLIQYFQNNRLIKKGLKVKAQIIEIKRTLLGVNSLPEYIVEVSYKHPNNKKIYYSEFEYCGDVIHDKKVKKGNEVDILIDPQNPENIYFHNVI